MKIKSSWDGLPRKITGLVAGESDRGSILILGSYLEEILSEVVQAHCVSVEAAKNLLGLRCPAGDFDSKIRIAVSLGFIHQLESDALQCIRKIRNKSAHFDFDDLSESSLFMQDSIIDQVSNLAGKVNLSLVAREKDVVRQTFEICCRLVAVRLIGRAAMAERPRALKTMNEMAAEYRESVRGNVQGDITADIDQAVRDGDFDKLKEISDAIGEAVRDALNEMPDAQSKSV